MSLCILLTTPHTCLEIRVCPCVSETACLPPHPHVSLPCIHMYSSCVSQRSGTACGRAGAATWWATPPSSASRTSGGQRTRGTMARTRTRRHHKKPTCWLQPSGGWLFEGGRGGGAGRSASPLRWASWGLSKSPPPLLPTCPTAPPPHGTYCTPPGPTVHPVWHPPHLPCHAPPAPPGPLKPSNPKPQTPDVKLIPSAPALETPIPTPTPVPAPQDLAVLPAWLPGPPAGGRHPAAHGLPHHADHHTLHHMGRGIPRDRGRRARAVRGAGESP